MKIVYIIAMSGGVSRGGAVRVAEYTERCDNRRRGSTSKGAMPCFPG